MKPLGMNTSEMINAKMLNTPFVPIGPIKVTQDRIMMLLDRLMLTILGQYFWNARQLGQGRLEPDNSARYFGPICLSRVVWDAGQLSPGITSF